MRGIRIPKFKPIRLRIASKLGISAGIGVVLVAGMMANDHFSKTSVERSQAVAQAQEQQVMHAISAKSAVQGSQQAMQQARYSRSIRDVERALESLETYAKEGHSHIEAGLKLTRRDETRERLTQIQTRFNDSLKAAREIADKQKNILMLENDRADATQTWTRGIETMLAAIQKNPSDDSRELELRLQIADSAFKTGRLAALEFQLTGDEALMVHIMRSTDETGAALKAALAAARTDAERKTITALTDIVGNVNKLLEQVVDLEEVKIRTVRLRTNLIASEIMELLDTAVAEATRMSAESDAQASADLTNATHIAFAIGAVVILILIASALLSLFNIARPIRRIGDVLLELSNGNKAVEIPYAKRGDEVGDAARAAQTFRDQLIRMEQLEAEQKEVERQSNEARKVEMHELASRFETAVGNVLESVTRAASDLEGAASTLTGTAESTQELSGTVARISEEASSNVHSVAAASDELSSSVNEIARQVQESTRIANEAVMQAQQTDSRIGDLLQAANRIGDVVKLITAIAEQTNLLALNATIEAARAGEAGRGFAVVAQEVKALAAQTAKATDEIGGQISAIQNATKDSVGAIQEIGATINRISEIATAVAAAVEEQGAATQEISRNAQQAAEGTTLVASNIADVNRAATETGSASSQVLASAQALAQEGAVLKNEVERFLSTVRAA
jgi:methyl-accepting chemotaxis protein